MRKRKLSPEEVRIAVWRGYQAGLSRRQIAHLLKISQTYVSHILIHTFGVEPRPIVKCQRTHHRKFSAEEAIRLYEQEGLSCSQIAARFGVSRQAVHATLKARLSKPTLRRKHERPVRLSPSMQVVAEAMRAAGLDPKLPPNRGADRRMWRSLVVGKKMVRVFVCRSMIQTRQQTSQNTRVDGYYRFVLRAPFDFDAAVVAILDGHIRRFFVFEDSELLPLIADHPAGRRSIYIPRSRRLKRTAVSKIVRRLLRRGRNAWDKLR